MKGRLHVIVRRTTRGPDRGLLPAACLLAVACGGDSGAPTGPTPPSTGAASSVSVAYPADHGTIYIGDQLQFEATVSSSGGGTQAVTGAVWASDALGVATVSPSGLVTGDSAGKATISAQLPAGVRDAVFEALEPDAPLRQLPHQEPRQKVSFMPPGEFAAAAGSVSAGRVSATLRDGCSVFDSPTPLGMKGSVGGAPIGRSEAGSRLPGSGSWQWS